VLVVVLAVGLVVVVFAVRGGVVAVPALGLINGSHGIAPFGVGGFVVCGTGVTICAGGVAVRRVGEAVCAGGVAVCGAERQSARVESPSAGWTSYYVRQRYCCEAENQRRAEKQAHS
jgi:hypothetical protein